MFEILYSNVPVKCKNKTKQNTGTRAKASLDDTMFNTEQDGPGGGEVWPYKCFIFNDTFSPGLLSIENATGNFVSAKKNSWSNKRNVSMTKHYDLTLLKGIFQCFDVEAHEVLFLW